MFAHNILMISLDKNILNKNSRVAGRMIEYGKQDKLFIIVPNGSKQFVKLSSNVQAQSTGGGKWRQFLRLKKIGGEMIKKEKIDLITTQDPFFSGLAGVCLKKRTGIALEVQLHGDFYGSGYYKTSGLKNLLGYFIGKFLVIKRADKIRVAGERIKKSLLDMGVSEDKIEVRPVSLSENVADYIVETRLHRKYPEYKKIFLCLGRIEPVKNIGFLVDIFEDIIKKDTDYLLLIIGEGSGKNKIKDKIKSLRLENNIRFEDWLDDPMSYIKTADCLLFPSLSEGYGLVPMEANLAGTPVIMNDVGVANYELKPSEKVKILPVNDKDAWIQAILSI